MGVLTAAGSCVVQAIIGPSMRNATAYTPMATRMTMVSTTATAMRIRRNVLLLIRQDYPAYVGVTQPVRRCSTVG